ncbi:hypothetical protein Tco_0374769 [Tanacetum coccineum]
MVSMEPRYDKWSNMGHLFKSITHRDLYDARLRDNMTLKEMVSNGQLMWPQEWYVKFPWIKNIVCPVLATDAKTSLFGEVEMGWT